VQIGGGVEAAQQVRQEGAAKRLVWLHQLAIQRSQAAERRSGRACAPGAGLWVEVYLHYALSPRRHRPGARSRGARAARRPPAARAAAALAVHHGQPRLEPA